MRGTQGGDGTPDRHHGIIPAYAGNTNPTERALLGEVDHPRVCGEHLNLFFAVMSSLGSSPRMRGTPQYGSGHDSGGWIIPAYAGNTY